MLYHKFNKGIWFLVAGCLQLVCIAVLSGSIATTKYKKDAAMHYGQFIKCPSSGPPGCANVTDLAILEVSKVATAIQYCLAVFLCSYLFQFGILILTGSAKYYFSAEVHHHVFNFMIVLSYIQSACGFFGPVLATWCFNDEMEDADWGISMALHWVQMPFSFFSFVVVFLTPMYTKDEDFVDDNEIQKV